MGEERRVRTEVFLDEPQLTVIGVTGSIGVVAQGQGLGETVHGLVGMPVINGVDIVPGGGSDGSRYGWLWG